MKAASKYFRINSAIILSFAAGVTVAQNKNLQQAHDSMMAYPLSEVVITASRSVTDRMGTPEAVEALKTDSVQKYQLRTGPEALAILPGVFVQKTNHGGGSPFLRGLTGNQTLLLIDGIRLSNATTRYGPNQYFNTIDVFSLGKIEVLRGSGSVQYGSDALGGTVQAFSPEANFTQVSSWGGSLLTRFATQGMEQSLHAGLHYNNNKSAFRGGISVRNFGDLAGGDTTKMQSPTGYKEFDFDLKARLKLNTASTLTLVFQNVHQQNVPVYHKVVLENYAVNKMDPQNRKLAYIRFSRSLNSKLIRKMDLTASLQHSKEGRASRKNGSDILRLENDRVRSLGFSVEAFTTAGILWSANSGAEIYNDMVSSRRDDRNLVSRDNITGRGLYPDKSAMTSLALFTIHRMELHKWNFTAGFRYNYFIVKVEDVSVGKTKLTPSAFVGNLAIMRKLNSSSNIFLSMNTGFRAPNIDDLGALGIVDFRYEIPNFDLKPEHSFQVQLGYKYQSPRFRGEIYLYRNELYNLIVRNRVAGDTIDGYPVYRKENAEHAFIQGIETVWELKLSPSLLLFGTLTYTYGRNITKKEPLRRIPPMFGILALEYRIRKVRTSLEWRAAGKQDRLAMGDIDDNRIPSGGTPDWSIINFHAGYSIHFIRLNFSIQNLFNVDYRYHGSGVNGYGRSAFLNLSLEI